MLTEQKSNKPSCKNSFAGNEIILDSSGSLFLTESSILVVAGLHFEKGSYFAKQGYPLPLQDTRATLMRLEKATHTYQPKQVICLGDNLHDANAMSRMLESDKQLLEQLCQSVHTWQWIIGNHDQQQIPLDKNNVKTLLEFSQHNIVFSHQLLNSAKFQIIGHYHPSCLINLKSQYIRGKCFIVSSNLIIMPAFGTYTGSLDIKDKIFAKIFKNTTKNCYFIYNNYTRRIPVK